MSKSNESKFEQAELDKIKDFQQRYVNVQMGFGQAEITRGRLDEQLINVDTFVDELREKLSEIQTEEKSFIEEVNTKYGDGVLDPETGIFTAKSE